MKEISVSLWELSLEEVLKLPGETQVLLYSPFHKSYRVMKAKRIESLFIKECYIYFLFEKRD